MKLILATLVCSLYWSTAPAQAGETTQAPEKKKHPEYQVPLFFAVMDKELKIKTPQVIYDLQKSKGQSLNLAGLVFDAESFTARLENNSLQFNWNPNLVPSGEITVINQQGKELWKHRVEGRYLGIWRFERTASSSMEGRRKVSFLSALGSRAWLFQFVYFLVRH